MKKGQRKCLLEPAVYARNYKEVNFSVCHQKVQMRWRRLRISIKSAFFWPFVDLKVLPQVISWRGHLHRRQATQPEQHKEVVKSVLSGVNLEITT